MSESTIRVNDDQMPWRPGDRIADVLLRLGVEPSDVTTALNGEFVPRALRTTTPMQPGDALTVFKPIVGG